MLAPAMYPEASKLMRINFPCRQRIAQLQQSSNAVYWTGGKLYKGLENAKTNLEDAQTSPAGK